MYQKLNWRSPPTSQPTNPNHEKLSPAKPKQFYYYLRHIILLYYSELLYNMIEEKCKIMVWSSYKKYHSLI